MQDRASSHSRASPSCWVSRPSGRAINSRFLDVDGLRVRYIGVLPSRCRNERLPSVGVYPSSTLPRVPAAGPGTEDKDAASVRADHAVPFGVGVFYFEVQASHAGRWQARDIASWQKHACFDATLHGRRRR